MIVGFVRWVKRKPQILAYCKIRKYRKEVRMVEVKCEDLMSRSSW